MITAAGVHIYDLMITLRGSLEAAAIDSPSDSSDSSASSDHRQLHLSSTSLKFSASESDGKISVNPATASCTIGRPVRQLPMKMELSESALVVQRVVVQGASRSYETRHALLQ